MVRAVPLLDRCWMRMESRFIYTNSGVNLVVVCRPGSFTGEP